jgi:hypothetical protein
VATIVPDASTTGFNDALAEETLARASRNRDSEVRTSRFPLIARRTSDVSTGSPNAAHHCASASTSEATAAPCSLQTSGAIGTGA